MKPFLLKIVRRLTGWLPFRSLRFQIRHWIHLHWESCEWELRNLEALLPAQRRQAIDIGANYGHYSAELSRFFTKVIAFELNTTLTRDLQSLVPAIEIHNLGLSLIKGPSTLFVPVHADSTPLVGWANLEKKHPSGRGTFIEKPVQLDLLDSFDFKDIDFIKIDVEGHEMEVLHGAKKTLSRNRPSLLVEIRADHLSGVKEFLQNLGYKEWYPKGSSRDPRMTNYFFINNNSNKCRETNEHPPLHP